MQIIVRKWTTTLKSVSQYIYCPETVMLIVTRSSLVLYRLGVGRGIEEFCFCDNKIYLIPYRALQYSHCPPHWQLIRNFL